MPRSVRRPKYRWSNQRSLRWLQVCERNIRRARRTWPYLLLVDAALVILLGGLELLMWEAETSSFWSSGKSLLLNPVLWMIILYTAWHGYQAFSTDWWFLRAYRSNQARLYPDPEVEAEAQRMYDGFRARRLRRLPPELLPPIVPAASGPVDTQ